MPRIKITPDERRTSAQKYTSDSTTVAEVLQILTNEQQIISENWEGTAFQNFEN